MHLLHIILCVLSAFFYTLVFVQVCSLMRQLVADVPKRTTYCSNMSACLIEACADSVTSLRCQIATVQIVSTV